MSHPDPLSVRQRRPKYINTGSALGEIEEKGRAEMDEQNRAACREAAVHYQSKFHLVTPLASEQLLQRSDSFVLVDVRTNPERATSIIEDAISLQELEGVDFATTDKDVVFYCTIGYRSGLEATRFQQQHPSLRVYNLDGIVAYSHVSPDRLVDPVTKEKVHRVHTFSLLWDWVNRKECESDSYGIFETALRLLQVGATVIVRTCQSIAYSFQS